MITKEKTNEFTNIKNVVAIMSGKGGVGKSAVTALTAVALAESGYKVGILDADITGPSIPKIFGINKKRAVNTSEGITPIESVKGIKIISINLLIDDESAPVIWRAPIITGTITQFYTSVNWGELDYLLIDLPPGTGDVPLTIMQSFHVDGAIIVSTPQDLVGLIVKKSINMVKKLNVPVLGIIENMSYYRCKDCDSKIKIFGESKVPEIAKEMNVDLLAEIPLDPELATLSDEGRIELYSKINLSFNDIFSNKILKKLGGLNNDYSS